MKIILGFALLSFVSMASAAAVKTTSFNYLRTTNDPYRAPIAELCGHVEGAATSPSFVRVVVDPKSKNPGIYNTVAGKDGNFCVVVATYHGVADVSMLDSESSVSALAK